jgi:universal stress protein A
MLAPTRITVPTDFSEYSDRALAQGLDIAQQYQAKLFLLHVVDDHIHRSSVDWNFPEELVRKINDGTVDWANAGFRKQLTFFPQAKEVEVATNVRHGIP